MRSDRNDNLESRKIKSWVEPSITFPRRQRRYYNLKLRVKIFVVSAILIMDIKLLYGFFVFLFFFCSHFWLIYKIRTRPNLIRELIYIYKKKEKKRIKRSFARDYILTRNYTVHFGRTKPVSRIQSKNKV